MDVITAAVAFDVWALLLIAVAAALMVTEYRLRVRFRTSMRQAMTETGRPIRSKTSGYLDKAHRCLSNAHADLANKLFNDAARNAYIAAFYAAQALIFERTGATVESHMRAHIEFARLAGKEPAIDERLPAFLAQGYRLKTTPITEWPFRPSARRKPPRWLETSSALSASSST
jgi:uncharacterized protein (UPF0332 family)